MHTAFAARPWDASSRPYKKPRDGFETQFAVVHSFGEVLYDSTGFVEINMDALSPELRDLLEVHSGFEQLASLAREESERRHGHSKDASGRRPPGHRVGRRTTVFRDFGQRLGLLVEKLHATTKHHIRCLKPNHTLEAGNWDNSCVQQQLARYGLLEIPRVRAAGYAHRRRLEAFVGYYKICSQKWSQKAEDIFWQRPESFWPIAERARLLLEELRVSPTGYIIGRSLVFLNDGALAQLDAERRKVDLLHPRMARHLLVLGHATARLAHRTRRRLAANTAAARIAAQKVEAAEKAAAERAAAAERVAAERVVVAERAAAERAAAAEAA
eukprot:1354809-Prymnesium_polylepis.1